MNFLYSVWGLRKLILILENLLFHLFYGARINNRVEVFGFPIISLAKSSKVHIGKNLVLISHSYFSEPGVNHPVVIRTLNSNARLMIGDNVGVSGGGIIVAKEITIGNDVMLGANTTITDTDFHPINPRDRRFNRSEICSERVIIEDNVFIGMNSLILKGVKIGKNSVIGANSVVTKDIPSNCIAAGIPARVIKTEKDW